MSSEQALARLNRVVHELGEHFDSVNVIVTYKEGTITHAHAEGVGNWFARYGSTASWVKDMEEDHEDCSGELDFT